MARRTNLGQSAEVEVIGLKDTLAALKDLDKQAAKELQRDLRSMAGEIMAGAYALAGRAPSGIRDAKYGITIGRPRGVRNATYGVRVFARSRDAAIAEFAGKPGIVTKPQGAALIRNLDAAIGAPGRMLWATWDAKKGELQPRMAARVAVAEAHTQRLIDQARDREVV